MSGRWDTAPATVVMAAVLVVLLAAPPGWARMSVVAAVGQLEPAQQVTLCDRAPGVISDVCGAVGDVIGGGVRAVVGGGAEAVFGALVGFVVDGAGWLLSGVAAFIDSSTDPQLRAGWFDGAYRDMAVVAALVMLPFVLLALVQALLRQDLRMMLDIVAARVPFAAIGTAAAVVVVDLLVRLTDELSAWVGRGIGADLSGFATDVGTALATMGGPGGPVVAGLAGLLSAALVAFAAFVMWLELLLRQAAIYVAVLFLPLGFMAMVWPATGHWLRRLVQGLVAIVLSKFVIVAVMALAASAMDADVVDEGFGVVISGGSMLALAALAPYVLLRLIPVFDAELSSQLEGTFRRPTAAVAAPVTGTQMAGILRQRVSGATRASGAAPAGSQALAGASGAATAGAAGAATVAAKARRTVVTEGGDRAVQVTDGAGGPSSNARAPSPGVTYPNTKGRSTTQSTDGDGT